MQNKSIGPIEILIGENGSKVPFSTSLLVRGKDDTALIDCGGGEKVFDYIRSNDEPGEIYLTHYHLDHVWGTHLFPNANVYTNKYDLKKLTNPLELAKANGVYAFRGKSGTEQWRKQHFPDNPGKRNKDMKPLWENVMGSAEHCYPYDQTITIAGEPAIMLHTPGHCEGYCCPYFPNYGVLYVGDFDLTSFGPWYNNADSDIDSFIRSACKTLEVDAEYFVTAHHKGIFNRDDYKRKLQDYLTIIGRREEKVKQVIQRGVPPKDIVREEIFYFRKNHQQDTSLLNSEIIGIAKHIQRLIRQGENLQDYYRAFISYHRLQEDYINYSSNP
jgi:hydroxyacylglutathione hydrolase